MTVGFHIEHFGCRAARADGEAVSDRLRAAGLGEREPSVADVVIVNTCSVTAEADRAARAFIRRAHRLNPSAKIVVTGCYAQRAPQELAGMAGVEAVVGNSHKALAPQIALSLLGHAAKASGLIQIQASTNLERADSELLAPPQVALAPLQAAQVVWAADRFAHSFLEEAQIVPGTQTRPNLKIQEGCANRCTFCVIPQTRGPSKSLSFASILRHVERFVAAGGNELVLSGINLGRWGRDLPDSEVAAPRTLAALVRQIFAQTALPRLRLSSIEPMDWDAELIGLMAEFGNPESGQARLARHAHLPLQSGSDAVLRRMHRRYRPWHYADKVAALARAAGPELTLGADVMVGFPGETDAEFSETLTLINAFPFGYLHLFPFSPRPGTPGWALHAERPVPAEVVEERLTALRVLASEKSQAHRRSFVGRRLEAITLHTSAEVNARGCTIALTENFLPVEFEGREPANQLVWLRVTGLNAGGTLQAEAEIPERAQQEASTISV
ncbi:MAG: radical SAM protein [Terracidiphilus sp.]|jgi:threonylcarbamoyladenosine tRNA methylthiotransferase MtaB